MSVVLETDLNDGVIFRTMDTNDVEPVIRLMAEAFFQGEPVTVVAGRATLRDHKAFCQMYVPRMAVEGHTVLAIDAQTQEVVGAFLNEDFANVDPPELGSFLDNSDGEWGPCLCMIEEIEQVLMQRLSIPAVDRPKGKWFHLWMIGVAPAGRGRGVGTKLAAHSIALARARGFEIAFAECTGAISTQIMLKQSAEKIAFCDYSTWTGKNAETLRGLPALGHEGMSMMLVNL